jgi:hypothetical protein
MSLHVRNLEKGDVFCGPTDLEAYYEWDNLDAYDRGRHWRVVEVHDNSDNDRLLRLAELRRPWNRISVILTRDVSLCETDEIPISLDWIRNVVTNRVKDWFWDRFPRLYQLLDPSMRPGARALREAVWRVSPYGKLVTAMERVMTDPAGTPLLVEDLSAILKVTTFDDSHLSLDSLTKERVE